MARASFGGGVADFIVAAVAAGDPLRPQSGLATFWDAETAGTQYTDLLLDGNPVDAIPVGDDGQVPTFQGPDGIVVMWAEVGGGSRVMVDAAGYIATLAQAAAEDAEAARLAAVEAQEAAEAVGATSDAQVAANVETGPLTGAALSASIDERVPAASTGTAGKAKLATAAQSAAGTATDLIVTPAGAKSAFVGKVYGLVANDSSAPVKTANAAILAAALVTGSSVTIPAPPVAGQFYYTDEVAVVGPIDIKGEGMGVTALRNNSGSVLAVSGSHINVSDIYLRSDGGGHTVRQAAAVDQGHWDRVKLRQDGTGYSVWDNSSASGHYGFVDMRFTSGLSWHLQTATVPTWNFVAAGGTLNNNTWSKWRAQYSGNYHFWVESTDVNCQHTNVWRDMTWEVTTGGMIKLIGNRNYVIDNGTVWDLAAGVGGVVTMKKHGIYADTNASGAICVGEIRNLRRLDGSCDGGVYDITLPSGTLKGAGTVIENCYNITSGNSLQIDLASNECLVRNMYSSASTLATYANSSGAVFIDKVGISLPSGKVLKTGAAAAASVPSAPTAGAGAEWFDTTKARMLNSDGTNWKQVGYVVRGSGTLVFGTVAATTTATATITVTGAVANDPVSIGPPSGINADLQWDGYVSAADTVTVRLRNPTGSGIVVSNATWKAFVHQ